MTRRFDRPDGDAQAAHAIARRRCATTTSTTRGSYSYEQALLAIRRLGLPMATVEQQFRRMAFNVIARNQDDHVKNIAFLMDRAGAWSLSPAFDVTYNYNPAGEWTAHHQMSVNGKRDGFAIEDFERCAESASMRRGRATEIAAEVREAVAEWPSYAAEAGVPEADAERIARTHRLDLPRR